MYSAVIHIDNIQTYSNIYTHMHTYLHSYIQTITIRWLIAHSICHQSPRRITWGKSSHGWLISPITTRMIFLMTSFHGIHQQLI